MPVTPHLAHATQTAAPDFLPRADAASVVDVTAGEDGAAAALTVVTEALATKEAGPKDAVARFGEVYAFSPSFIAVHRDEPTAIAFWNLQATTSTTSCLPIPSCTS